MRRKILFLMAAFVSLTALLAPGEVPVRSAAGERVESPVFLSLVLHSWVIAEPCPLGLHLSAETVPLIMAYQQVPGTVSAFTYAQAETYFPPLGAWRRLIVQPSLEGLQTKAQRAAEDGLAYEALAYALDERPSTPEAEWQNPLAATQAARIIADQYGKQLILAPGILLMAENPELYPLMADLADGWLIDGRIFQNANPPGELYRWDVTTVVNRLRGGNPGIAIWVQIGLDAVAPDPDTWLAYWVSLAGLVDAGDIAANFGDAQDPQVLLAAMEAVILQACPGPGRPSPPTPEFFGQGARLRQSR